MDPERNRSICWLLDLDTLFVRLGKLDQLVAILIHHAVKLFPFLESQVNTGNPYLRIRTAYIMTIQVKTAILVILEHPCHGNMTCQESFKRNFFVNNLGDKDGVNHDLSP